MFWLFFAITLFILLLNIGLFFVVFGIVLFPILIIHVLVGIRMQFLKNNKWLVVLSFLNLLFFALIRPDGVHETTHIGLSSFLELFGMYGFYNPENEQFYFTATSVILIIQILIDVRLLNRIRKIRETKMD
jgi:hypothetical protein